jgi:hypothetical protein
MNIPDHVSERLETIFWVKILKVFDAHPDSGSGTLLNLDPGWKKLGSGTNIPDPQHYIFKPLIFLEIHKELPDSNSLHTY